MHTTNHVADRRGHGVGGLSGSGGLRSATDVQLKLQSCTHSPSIIHLSRLSPALSTRNKVASSSEPVHVRAVFRTKCGEKTWRCLPEQSA